MKQDLRGCGTNDYLYICIDMSVNERSIDFFNNKKTYNFIIHAIIDVDTKVVDVFAGYHGMVYMRMIL